MKTVKDIIREWLKANGYDGLCTDCCGCGIDDLAPCCVETMDCRPAYRHVATEDLPEIDVDKGQPYYSPAPKEQT